jgi:hypothetical protein
MKSLREPFMGPPGFGLRQSSGALDYRGPTQAAEDGRTPRRCRVNASPSVVRGHHARLGYRGSLEMIP